MIPISRVEMYLAKICGEDVELPIPQTRKEVFLAIIAGESHEKPVPSSRVELYLAKILGDDVPIPIPQSREEIFLAKIAGVEYPLPYPESRIEYWLHKWATYEEWSTISGNPVSFTAKAAPLRQLEVAFSPVQSLNGYDAPWPAGGGANKWDGTFNTFIPLEIASGTTVCLQAVLNDTSRYITLRTYDSNQTFLQSMTASTVSGNINYGVLTLTSDAAYIRVEKASDITATDGMLSIGNTQPTSYAPYSNICPISGWSSLTVEQRGKNLLHGTEYSGLFYSSAVGTDLKGTRSGTSYEQSGNETTVTAGAWTGCVFTTEVLPAGTYHIGFSEDSNSRVSAFVTDENLIVESLIKNWAGKGSADTAVTLTESRRISMWIGCGSTGTATVTDLQVELGSSFTEWQAYNPSSRSISVTFPAMGKNKLKLTADNIVRKNGGTLFSDEFGQNSYTMKDVAGVYALAVFWGLFMVTEDMVGQKVTFSMTKTGGEGRWALAADGNDWSTNTPLDLGMSATITIESSYVGHALGFRYYNPTGATQTISNVQVEFSASATAFEPYTNVAYSGTVDVVTGVGEIDYIKKSNIVFQGFFEGYNPYKQFYFTDATLTRTGAEAGKMKSNLLTYNPALDSAPLWSYGAERGVASAMICILPFDTTAEANAWASENGLECIFKLAEPIPIQLTPQEVESLAGDNTMWTDAASLEVTYRSN